MASGPTTGGDGGAREKQRYNECKVYTRKAFKGPKKNPNVGNTVVPATATTKDDNAATTTVTKDTDSNNKTTTKGNIDNVLAQPPAPQTAVTEDEKLAQPEETSRFEGGDLAQSQESSRLEGGNLAQPQESSRLGDGNSPQPQTSSRLEDRDSPHPQANSRPEDGKSPQPQANSRPVDGKSPQPQVNSGLEDRNSSQPQRNSGLEDGSSSQPEGNSKLEDTTSQPQVNLRLEDGNSPQPEGNSKLENTTSQPQANLRLEDGNFPQPQVNSGLEDGSLSQPQVNSGLDGCSLPQPEGDSKLEDTTSQQQDNSRSVDGNLQVNLRLEDGNSPQPLVNSRLEEVNLAQPLAQPVSDDSRSHQPNEPSNLNVQQEKDGPLSPSHWQQVVPSTQDLPSTNGAVEPWLEDRIKINLASKSKQEMRELRWKLESELGVVRSLVKKIEVKQGQDGGCGNSNVLAGGRIANGGGAKRSHSEVASAGVPRQPTRPLHQLSLSMLENSQGVSENVEKEKRTPKANQFYHNSEFLLAKDKFPPAESNKKSKLNWKKQGGGEMGHGLRMGSKFFKSCSSLLEKLMKHKHGWVFNAPVDVEGLGLHDYFTIITHPMDLGTVKTRLNKNWYKSPKEFAEDVRLTFRNAMTYNPQGQDVHVMAEQLSKIFEDRWAIIESDYNREMRYGIDYGATPPAPSPLSRKAPAFPPPALDMRRILDRSESLARTPKPMSLTPSSRTPALKKPKAKDPHKRDMTFEEKQKLSTNLQSLPPEKLDAIVQIIKRRNLALNQHDDEIEVDIDSVDAETLWELDRFVTNYKKSLSKNKRRAELARARAEAMQNAIQKSQASAMVEIPKETQTDERNVPPSLPVQGGNQADNRSRSSSSSSSSSDSGSSSSDSDSDSSSASGSDAGSQGT